MYILFDIGGTKTRIASTKNGDEFSEPKIIRTPDSFEEWMGLFQDVVSKIVGDEAIEGIAGGVAGTFDKKNEILFHTSHLIHWSKKPVKKILEDTFQAPVFIDNDSAIVGLGEMKYGAGRGFTIGAYITVSTGVGGARYINGTIDKNSFGFEPGHQIIKMGDSIICPSCHHAGCLESLVSGSAIHNRLGKHPRDIHVAQFWKETAHTLSQGLYNTILHWSPDGIVLGGSMITGDPAISVSDVREYLKEMMKIFPELPEIKKAELGDFGGIYGAMELLKQKKVFNKK